MAPSDRAHRVIRLEELAVPRLFFTLLHSRFTGTVQLDQSEPPGRRTIWILGGMPVHTDWISPSETLGQLLLNDGAISGEQLFEALRSSAGQDAARIGQILVEQGAIGDARLAAALQRQCFRKLVHVFGLRTGTVKIRARPHGHGRDEERGQVNVLRLIVDGVAAHYDLDRIRHEMGSAASERFAPNEAFSKYASHFQLTELDQPIVRALDRGASLDQLCAVPGIDHARAGQLLFTLWTCQMVAPTAKGSREEAPRTAPEAPARPAVTAPTPVPESPSSDQSQAPLLQEAAKLLHAGKFGQALTVFQQIAMERPEDPTLRAHIIWCDYHCSGKAPEQAQRAIDAITMVLEEHPDAARAHYYRGLLHMRLGAKHVALKAFMAAVEADPTLTDAERHIKLIRKRFGAQKSSGKRRGLAALYRGGDSD